MNQYRGRNSSTSEATTTPVPTTPVPAPVMRFKLTDSVYNRKALPSESTVVAEFEKYALGSSSDEANILQFWEVGILMIEWRFGTTTLSLNRLIGPNSQRCSQSRWITSRCRQRPFLVSVCSHQQRIQTPRSETESTRFSWRPFKCSNMRSGRTALTLWPGGKHRKQP